MPHLMRVAVVIVAAGRGRRLGDSTPKQYIPLAGHCSLRRVMDTFLSIASVKWVVPVINAEDHALYADAVKDLSSPRVMAAVEGGASRAKSVRCGLESLEAAAPDLVLVHDAARPFLPVTVVQDVLHALTTSDGACAALPVVDALWRSEVEVNHQTSVPTSVPRDGVWRAQTPQGFRFGPFLRAHRNHDGHGADDIAVAREAGLSVTFVQGSEENYKITTAPDLNRALSDAIARKVDIEAEPEQSSIYLRRES